MEFRVLIHRFSRLKPSKSYTFSPISLLTARNFSQFQNHSLNSLFKHFTIHTQLPLSNFVQIEPFSSKSDHCGAQNVLQQSRLVKEMENMGLQDETIKRLFVEVPLVNLKDLVGIKKKIDVLIFFELIMDEINRVLFSFPGYFALNYDNRLRPLFEELHKLGFAKKEVREVMLENPKIFLALEAGELSRYVELLKSLKCRQPIKDKILINGYLKAAMNVKLRIECLHKHGLILRDAFKVLFVDPRVILYNLEDIQKKIKFLVNKMNFCMDCIVECPEYLGVNLEKQIIPRYNVFEYLRSVGGLGDEVWMKHYVKMSRMKFYNMFVKPYPECIRIFEELKKGKEMRLQHPAGLWKLFRP